MTFHWAMHDTLGVATLLAWMTLLVVPFMSSWPHGGARGNVERAALYFAVAAVTRATITDHHTRWQIAALAIAAALFEGARFLVAGRSNGVRGWMSSTAGAVTGALLLREVAHAYFWSWGW